MNPEQPRPLSDSTPLANQAQPISTSDQPAQQSPKNRSIKGPLLLMFAPGIVLVLTLVLYMITNFIFSVTSPAPSPSDSNLFGDSGGTSVVRSIMNVILFLAGAASIVGGLPCFIGGLIWLIKRKTDK